MLNPPSKKNILFLLSGSISCYKSVQILSALVQKNYSVKVVCTPSALKFVGKATFEGITKNPVYTEVFESGQMMGHINWARWADIFVLCPATANTINKLSQGLGDDLITNLVLSKETHKPFLIFPSMNEKMYQHPATQTSIEKLSSWGYQIFPTDTGPLACGEFGEGRLLNPELILKHIENNLSQKKYKRKIIITSGATKEAIDAVRYISNISSGKTGSTLATYLIQNGYDITYLHGKDSLIPNYPCKKIFFTNFKNLDQILKKQLGSNSFDAIIHAAAVSDYSIDFIIQDEKRVSIEDLEKLSSKKEFSIQMKINHKIINKIKEYSLNKKIKIVGFKLTSTENEKKQLIAVKNILQESSCNLVVQNDIHQINSKSHSFRIFKKDLSYKECRDSIEMSKQLEKLIFSKNSSPQTIDKKIRHSETEKLSNSTVYSKEFEL